VDVERTIYLAGAVAVGWAVTYALRALPFLLFSRSSRELPKWVEKLGNVVSPVIIAALVVYSYSGLEWRLPRPYLAGMITVTVHLWLRNPLVSIVAGTAAYMAWRWIG
jgi:branched-subunit amino acid transport protein AzlD